MPRIEGKQTAAPRHVSVCGPAAFYVSYPTKILMPPASVPKIDLPWGKNYPGSIITGAECLSEKIITVVERQHVWFWLMLRESAPEPAQRVHPLTLIFLITFVLPCYR